MNTQHAAPFICRSKTNRHQYVVLGKTVKALATFKKDMEYLVASLFGQTQQGLLSTFTPSIQQVVATGAVLAVMSTQAAMALPVNPNVQSGSVSFTQTKTNLEATVGTQQSSINWDSFNIAENESVNFNFLKNNSISLNRVIGGDASKIYGNLSGNGTLFLINGSGILFGAQSSVNVNGLVASTLNITNANFNNGRFMFENNGASGSVVNDGSITINNGGYALLAGSAVANNGSISALNGQVALAAGQKLSISTSDGLFVEVTEGVKDALANFSDAVSNTGSIASASAVLQANLDGALYKTAVNTQGQIHATTANFKPGGVVELLAYGGDLVQGGDVVAEGGDITIHSDANTLLASGSTTSAKGMGTNGDAGSVTVWSDDTTTFEKGATIDVSGGTEGGNGGFVEVSAKDTVVFEGQAKGDSVDGVGGHILIDPTNVVFQTGGAAAGGNTVNANDAPVPGTTTLDPASFSGFNTVTIEALEDITVKNDLILTNIDQIAESVTFNAGEDINVNAKIQTFGGHINLNADADLTGSGGLAPDGVGNININPTGSLDAGTGDVNLDAVRVINQSSITGNNITVTATERVQNKTTGSVMGSGTVHFDVDAYGNIDNDGLIQSTGQDVLLEAGNHNAPKNGSDIDNDGTIKAFRNVTLTSGDDIQNRGTGLIMGENVEINVTDDFLNNTDATITATKDVVINNGVPADMNPWRDTVNKGSISAGENVYMEAGDDIRLTSTSNVTAGQKITLAAGDDINSDAGSTTSGKAIDINGKGDIILSGNTLSTTGNIDVKGEDITNNGNIQSSSGGHISLMADDQTVNTSTISTSGDILLQGGDPNVPVVGNLVKNDGGIIQGGQITVKSGEDFNNRANGTLIAAKGFDADVDQQFLNQAGSKITANGSAMSINADHVDNVGGTLKATNQDLTITTVNHIDNESAGTIDAGVGNIVLNAGSRVHNIGGSSITGNIIDIDAGDPNVANVAHTVKNEGTINGNAAVTIDAGGTISQKNGGLLQGQSLKLNTADNIELTDGTVTSLTTIEFDAKETIKNIGATVTAQNGLLHWDAGKNIDNRSTVTATTGPITMLAADDFTNSGTLQAEGDVTLRSGIDANFVEGDDFVNTGSISGANISITSADDVTNNNGGSITGSGTVTVVSADQMKNGEKSSIDGDGKVDLTSGGKFVSEGTIASTNSDVDVKSGDSIRIDNSLTAHNGAVLLDADNRVEIDTNGTVNAKNDIQLLSGDLNIFQEGDDVLIEGNVTSTNGQVKMRAGDDIQNKATVTAVSIDAEATDNVDNAAGASLSTTGDIRLATGTKTTFEESRDIDNAGNITSSAGNITLDAGDDTTNKSTGVIRGVDVTIKTADNFTNHAGGDIAATGTLAIEACGDIRNDGQLGSTATDTTTLTAEGNIFGSGLTIGDMMSLTSTNGSIGSLIQPFNTNATHLGASAVNGGITIHEANSVILGDLTAGGALTFTNGNTFPGIFDPLGSGTVRLDGLLTGDSVNLNTLGSILDGDTPALNIQATHNSILNSVNGTVGSGSDPIEVNISNGTLTVGAGGSDAGVSVNIAGTVSPSNTLSITNPLPPGSVLFNGAFLTLAGLGDGILNQGLPFLTVGYNANRSVFKPTLSVASTIGQDIITNTKGVIVNERRDTNQLFDLRLLEEESAAGEPIILLQLAEDEEETIPTP